MGKVITLFSPTDIETVMNEISNRQDMEVEWKLEDGSHIDLEEIKTENFGEQKITPTDWIKIGMQLVSEELKRRFERNEETSETPYDFTYFSEDTPKLTK